MSINKVSLDIECDAVECDLHIVLVFVADQPCVVIRQTVIEELLSDYNWIVYNGKHFCCEKHDPLLRQAKLRDIQTKAKK